MIVIRMDVDGALEVRWPKQDRQTVALAEAYLRRENGLPAAERLPYPLLTDVQAALAAVQNKADTAGSGEQGRAQAAELYRQTMARAIPRLELALLRLKGQYADNLAALEAWGLHTKTGARGVTVIKPRTEKGWVDFLHRYVVQEQSMAEAKRVSDPPLDEMQGLAQTLEQSNRARTEGRTQREIGVQGRSAAGQRLLDIVQLAAFALVVGRYDGQVTNDLQQWGYTVVARASTGGTSHPPATP